MIIAKATHFDILGLWIQYIKPGICPTAAIVNALQSGRDYKLETKPWCKDNPFETLKP